MPNWIENKLCVKNTSPNYYEIVQIFSADYTNHDGGPFDALMPEPIDLKEVGYKFKILKMFFSGLTKFRNIFIASNPEASYEDSFKTPRRHDVGWRVLNYFDKLIRRSNLKNFGAENWFEWRHRNWGVKWDASSLEIISSTQNEFCIEFRTPWSIPDGVYEHLHNRFPEIDFIFGAISFEANRKMCGGTLPGYGLYFEDVGPLFIKDLQPIFQNPSKKFLTYSAKFENYVFDSIYPTKKCKKESR